MPQTINRASVVETTLGITFQIGELPTQTVGNVIISNRTIPTYTITTSASASALSESLTVQATPVLLDAGTLLNFGGVIATLSNAAAAGATMLQTLPLPGDIGNAATAVTKALVFVAGCTEAQVSPQIKNSDTTNYLSGLGMEKVTVGNAKTMTLNFNLIYGDRGGAILRKIAYDKAYAGREFYFYLLFPSGEAHEGVALLETASPTNPVQEKRSFSCTAQVQGNTYIYTPHVALNIF
ncbi:MAG: phage tail tube protein [Nostoc sp.]